MKDQNRQFNGLLIEELCWLGDAVLAAASVLPSQKLVGLGSNCAAMDNAQGDRDMSKRDMDSDEVPANEAKA